jgi:hypothetical protein
MGIPIIKPETVADAWLLYVNELKICNPAIIPLAQTALFRYTLPGYGMPNDLTKNDVIAFMKKYLSISL